MFWMLVINNVKYLQYVVSGLKRNMPKHQYGLKALRPNRSWSEVFCFLFFFSWFLIFMNAGVTQMDWTQIASSENLLMSKWNVFS